MFWMDLDIKGGNHKSDKYPSSLEEALPFVYSLPWAPTFIVCSGGGLHIYYLFENYVVIEDDISRSELQDLSKKVQGFIKRKGSEHGWRLDGTADLARILRIPGTFNLKPAARGVNYLKKLKFWSMTQMQFS